MKPWKHSRISAKKFGGSPEDYIDIHEWVDQTKAAHADMRHRAILHNSMGPYIAAQVFGNTIVNTAGRTVSVRDIVEQHIIDDLGFIPNLSDYLKQMTLAPWMGGKVD